MLLVGALGQGFCSSSEYQNVTLSLIYKRGCLSVIYSEKTDHMVNIRVKKNKTKTTRHCCKLNNTVLFRSE